MLCCDHKPLSVLWEPAMVEPFFLPRPSPHASPPPPTPLCHLQFLSRPALRPPLIPACALSVSPASPVNSRRHLPPGYVTPAPRSEPLVLRPLLFPASLRRALIMLFTSVPFLNAFGGAACIVNPLALRLCFPCALCSVSGERYSSAGY